jgi:hypothetical protein
MSLRWFVGLFAIAIWNRDSAIFIALWLILDPLVRLYYRRQHMLPSASLDWRRMLAGATCIAGGLLTAELLRRNLLVEEMGPKLYPDSPINYPNRYHFGHYSFNLASNIAFTKQWLTHFDREFWSVIPAFLATATALGMCLVRRDPQHYLALYLVELSFIASLFVFGWFTETRLFFPLIPFIVMPAVLLSHPKGVGVSCYGARR